MNLEILTEDGLTILKPSGPMNAETAPLLQTEIDENVTSASGRLALDLTAVPFISSCGLRTVIRTSKLAKELTGAQLMAFGLEPPITQIFKLAGLDRILELHGTLNDVRGLLCS